MSFRTEANKVKAGIARGDYKQKRDYFASFVDPLVAQMQKQDAIKIQEDLDKRREARAEARELRKLQTAQDAKDKKDEALVNTFMLTQGASGEVAKSQVSSLVKSGYDDLAKLTEYFEKNAKFNPDVITNQVSPPSSMQIGSVQTQMESIGLGKVPDGEASEIARTLDGETRGAFEFGKQPERYDLGKLRPENYEGERAQAVKDGRSDIVSDIDAWAASQGLTKITGQLTQEIINGASLDELRKLDLQYENTPEIKAAIVIEEKLKEKKQPWNNPQELILLDINTLTSYNVGSSKLGDSAKANIKDALDFKLAIQKSNNLAEVSQQFDKDSSFYDAALRQLGKIDATSSTVAQDLQTFKALTDLKSLAVEKEKEAKYQDMRNLNAKEQALQAFYTEKGFFVASADGSVLSLIHI